MAKNKVNKEDDLVYIPNFQSAVFENSKEKGYLDVMNLPRHFIQKRYDEQAKVEKDVYLIPEEDLDIYRRMSMMTELGGITTEIAEAMQLVQTEKLTTGFFEKFGRELADIIIRTMVMASRFDIDICDEMIKKHKENLKREGKNGKYF